MACVAEWGRRSRRRPGFLPEPLPERRMPRRRDAGRGENKSPESARSQDRGGLAGRGGGLDKTRLRGRLLGGVNAFGAILLGCVSGRRLALRLAGVRQPRSPEVHDTSRRSLAKRRQCLPSLVEVWSNLGRGRPNVGQIVSGRCAAGADLHSSRFDKSAFVARWRCVGLRHHWSKLALPVPVYLFLPVGVVSPPPQGAKVQSRPRGKSPSRLR